MPGDCHCIYDSHVCSHFSIWGSCRRTPLQFHLSNMSSYWSTTFMVEATDRTPSSLYKLSCVCTCPIQRVLYFGFQIWRRRSRKCFRNHKRWSTPQSNNSKKCMPARLNWNQIELQAKFTRSPCGLYLDSMWTLFSELESMWTPFIDIGLQMDSNWNPNGLRPYYDLTPTFCILCCVWSFIVHNACHHPIDSGCFTSMCHLSCELFCVRFVVLLVGWRVCRCAW